MAMPCHKGLLKGMTGLRSVRLAFWGSSHFDVSQLPWLPVTLLTHLFFSAPLLVTLNVRVQSEGECLPSLAWEAVTQVVG